MNIPGYFEAIELYEVRWLFWLYLSVELVYLGLFGVSGEFEDEAYGYDFGSVDECLGDVGVI